MLVRLLLGILSLTLHSAGATPFGWMLEKPQPAPWGAKKLGNTRCEQHQGLIEEVTHLHVTACGNRSVDELRLLANQALAGRFNMETPLPDMEQCSDLARFEKKNDTHDSYELALQALLYLCDPHSWYLSKSTGEALVRRFKEGQSVHHGIFGDTRTAHEWIPPKAIEIMDLIPASNAAIKLKVGQKIRQINKMNLGTLNPDQWVGSPFFKMTPGPLELLLESNSKSVIITVESQPLQKPAVWTRTLTLDKEKKSYAYIRLEEFAARASEEVAGAIRQFEGKKVAGYILDLRGNLGGKADEGIKIADHFLDRDLIVTERRNPNIRTYYPDQKQNVDRFATQAGVLTDKPLVVLVDKFSASASEVLVGALRRSRAAIIGADSTYGKATGQAIFPLGRESSAVEGYLGVTSFQFVAPNGESAQGKGFVPHMVLADPVMTQALEARDNDVVSFVYGEDELPGVLFQDEEAKPAAPQPMEKHLSKRKANQLVDEVSFTCNWETKDCHIELGLKVLKAL